MASVTHFIERRLRLKVNASKSAVARPNTRHFLGYRLAPKPDCPAKILLSKRSEKRLWERIRELTPRSCGRSLSAVIKRVNAYLHGWLGHFGVCTPGIGGLMSHMDAHIRRRLRALVLKHWKRKRTIARRLIRLGVKRRTAWRRVYQGRKSLWALSCDYAVHLGLTRAYFADRGLVSLHAWFKATWAERLAPRQQSLFAVPERS